MKLEDFEYNFIDQIFDFNGLWDRKSKCGLKVLRRDEQSIVIVTDLYKENPGGSITEFCAELAMVICKEYNIDLNKLLFVHHVPEMKSSLEFYAEVFYKVMFDTINGQLTKPDWHSVEREEIEKLVQA
ncbi:hypothetical protein OAA06_00680 [bacterium]|nr:hypothetical protein [bacterium]